MFCCERWWLGCGGGGVGLLIRIEYRHKLNSKYFRLGLHKCCNPIAICIHIAFLKCAGAHIQMKLCECKVTIVSCTWF